MIIFYLGHVLLSKNSNGTWKKSFTHIEHRTEAVGPEGLVSQIPVLTPEYLLSSQWIRDFSPRSYLFTSSTVRDLHFFKPFVNFFL